VLTAVMMLGWRRVERCDRFFSPDREFRATVGLIGKFVRDCFSDVWPLHHARSVCNHSGNA
jgi:hypothetical protein